MRGNTMWHCPWPGAQRTGYPRGLQAKEALERGETMTYTVTEKHISDALGDLLKKKDLSKYIL